jgi:hypothetical protein
MTHFFALSANNIGGKAELKLKFAKKVRKRLKKICLILIRKAVLRGVKRKPVYEPVIRLLQWYLSAPHYLQ